MPSGGSSTGSNKNNIVTGDGWVGDKDAKTVTITKNADLTTLANRLNTTPDKLAVTIDAPNITLTGSEGANKIASLTISDKVGNGDVTIENMEIVGTTTVNGGGSDSVKLFGCTLGEVIAAKKSNNNNSLVRIEFGTGTTVEKVNATDGQLKLTVVEGVTVPNVITTVPITLEGAGTVSSVEVKEDENNADKTPIGVTLNLTVPVTTFTTTAPIALGGTGKVNKFEVNKNKKNEVFSVVLDVVVVEKLSFNTYVKVEVKKDLPTDLVVEDKGGKAEITGTGTITGYYEVIFNPMGGYWEVKENTGNKKVKINKEEGIQNYLSTVIPKKDTGSTVFSGWYEEENYTILATNKNYEGQTLYAKWTDQVVKVTSAEITGTLEVGKVLTAKANDGATLPLTCIWKRSGTQGGSYEEIGRGLTYTLSAEDAGKYITVTIQGADASESTSNPKFVPNNAVTPPSTLGNVAVTITGSAATVSDKTENTVTVKVPTGSSATVIVKDKKVVLKNDNSTQIKLKDIVIKVNGEDAIWTNKEESVSTDIAYKAKFNTTEFDVKFVE